MKSPTLTLIAPNPEIGGVQYDFVAQAFDQRKEGRENWLGRVQIQLLAEEAAARAALEFAEYS